MIELSNIDEPRLQKALVMRVRWACAVGSFFFLKLFLAWIF